MRDKDFLQWIHDRLEHQHGENPNYDYMSKLRAIIRATDPERETPNIGDQQIKDVMHLTGSAD